MGYSGTIAVGTVTALDPGLPPTVINVNAVSSPSAALFNFGIPSGYTGSIGYSGTIAVGTVTALTPGFTPTVVNTNSPGNITSSTTYTTVTGNKLSTSGTYNGVAVKSTSGVGIGATFNIQTTTSGGAGPYVLNTNVSILAVATGGYGYAVGNTITISGASIGGSEGTHDLTFTLATSVGIGTPSAARLNFGIPTGYTGSNGAAATIAIGNSYSGSAGTRSRVTNTGTTGAAVFDFILPTGYTGSFDPATNFAFPGSTSNLSSVFTNMAEPVTVVGTAISGTPEIILELSSSSISLYTTAATSSWILNIRHATSTTLASVLALNQVVTCQLLVTQGAGGLSYFCTDVKIDGTLSNVTTYWQGNKPTAGNASGIDGYSFSIVKTSTSTTPHSYTVFASQSAFKT